MRKIISSLIVLSALIIFACSKDQRAVNRLEGTWKVSAVSENGVAQPDSTFVNTSYTFNKCKVKKDDCDGVYTEDGSSTAFTYNISDKGTKLNLIVDFLGTKLTVSSEVIELTKNKFVIRTTQNGETTEVTMTK